MSSEKGHLQLFRMAHFLAHPIVICKIFFKYGQTCPLTGIYYLSQEFQCRTSQLPLTPKKEGSIAMKIPENSNAIDRLLSIMNRLRSPAGCAWDRRQSPETLKPFILEETYELLEAIDSNNPNDIRDEMGDLLLQITFLAQIFTEQEIFNFSDIATAIADKMIRRHPHIFSTESDINQPKHWEEIKTQERLKQGKDNLLRNRIPASLPALKASIKIIKNQKNVTPDYIHTELATTMERLRQQTAQIAANQALAQNIAEAFNILAKLAYINHLDPEDILRQYNNSQIASIDNATESKISKQRQTS